MLITIMLHNVAWIFTMDVFQGQGGTEFSWKPKLFFVKHEHFGIHWLGCCCCLER